MWCSAADTHIELLDRVVSGASFITWGVYVCDIAHRRSLAVLCMLYKFRCKLMRPLYGALLGPYVPLLVRRGDLVIHRYTYLTPFCSTLSVPLFLSECPCGMTLLTLYSIVWVWQVSRAGPMLFYWPKLLYPYYFPFLCFLSIGWYCGAGTSDW